MEYSVSKVELWFSLIPQYLQIPTQWPAYAPPPPQPRRLTIPAGFRDWSKRIGGVGRSREGVGHEVLSLVQGVGRAIFSYPQGVGHSIFY